MRFAVVTKTAKRIERERNDTMITYSLLTIAAVWALAKWIYSRMCKNKALTARQMDEALIRRLNGTEGTHAD